MITPYVSQVLIDVPPSPQLALGLYMFICIAAAISAFMLPVETRGKAVNDDFDVEPDVTDDMETMDEDNLGNNLSLPSTIGDKLLESMDQDSTNNKTPLNDPKSSQSEPVLAQFEVEL